jgi:hypothetical protein
LAEVWEPVARSPTSRRPSWDAQAISEVEISIASRRVQ